MESILVFGFVIRLMFAIKFRKDYAELGENFFEKYAQFFNALSFLIAMIAVYLDKIYDFSAIIGFASLGLAFILLYTSVRAGKKVEAKRDALEKNQKEEV